MFASQTFIRRTHRRLMCAAAAVAAVITTSSFAQNTIVDTGQGNTSGGYSLFNSPPDFNFLGCRFSSASAFTIGTVQPWMVRPSGSIVVKLCANNGSNLPGSVLASQTFPVSFAGFSAQWTSFIVSGAAWSQPAGTYWVLFEPTSGTTNGGMPGNAPNPLPATSYYNNGNPGYVLNGVGDVNGRFGLRLFTPASPPAIHVPADHATIQAAINAAIQPNTEILVAPGTYNGAINYNGKTLKIRKDAAAARGGGGGRGGDAIIDATGSNLPAVTIGSGSGSGTELDGFTIRGGNTVTGLAEGGGVLVNNATALIKNCIITLNNADSGGGVAATSSANATFQDCVIVDNTSDTLGGGAYVNSATLVMTDCTLDSNSSGDGGGLNVNNGGTATVNGCTFSANFSSNAGGGATVISSSANAAFTNCDFEGNAALQGGGAFVSGGVGSFTSCNFVSNSATVVGLTSGGGIQATGSTGSLTVDTCWFFDNSAENGAGVQLLNYSGTTNISSSMFDANIANTFAGGLHVRNSAATVTNSIFTDNQADFGGGVYIAGTGSMALSGSSFCGNSPDAISGTFTNNGGNFLTCFDPGDTNGDGIVNVTDLLVVIGAWGTCPAPPAACPADLNDDGIVNVTDLLAVIGNWG